MKERVFYFYVSNPGRFLKDSLSEHIRSERKRCTKLHYCPICGFGENTIQLEKNFVLGVRPTNPTDFSSFISECLGPKRKLVTSFIVTR